MGWINPRAGSPLHNFASTQFRRLAGAAGAPRRSDEWLSRCICTNPSRFGPKIRGKSRPETILAPRKAVSGADLDDEDSDAGAGGVSHTRSRSSPLLSRSSLFGPGAKVRS